MSSQIAKKWWVKTSNIEGCRFGRLTVISKSPSEGKGTRWLCICDCGTQKVILGYRLRIGSVRSCGCLWTDAIVKHGKSSTAEYRSWNAMRHRCEDPKCQSFPNYGGRGIKVCRRWSASFPAFLEDMGNKPNPSLSIERRDNNGDYTPENCYWATDKEQQNNTRWNRRLTHNGQTKTVSEWAEETGLNPSTIHSRSRRDWPVSKILQRTLFPK